MTSSAPKAGRLAREDVPIDDGVTMDFQGNTGGNRSSLIPEVGIPWPTEFIPLEQIVGLQAIDRAQKVR